MQNAKDTDFCHRTGAAGAARVKGLVKAYPDRAMHGRGRGTGSGQLWCVLQVDGCETTGNIEPGFSYNADRL